MQNATVGSIRIMGSGEARSSRGSATMLLYWTIQLLVWGAYFGWQASGEVTFSGVPWGNAIANWGSFCIAGLGLTEGLRRWSKRNGWLKLPASTLIARLALSLMVLTSIAYMLLVATSMAADRTPVAPMLRAFYGGLPLWNQLANQFVLTLTVFLMWIAAYFGVATIRQRYQTDLIQAQLAEALKSAELRLLEAQLNPHFLFNALNSVRALIPDEPERAQDAITRVARTLRYTLASGGGQLVTLARELEMVDDYLALESLRLTDRLRVIREVDSDASDVPIPVMLLQGLVENAIKHGIAPLRQGGTLHIAAHTTPSELIVEVENPRPAQAGPESRVAGVGLENSRRRLDLLFGARASLELDLSESGRAVARVRLPR